MKDNIFKNTFAGAAIAALLITLGCQNLSVAKKLILLEDSTFQDAGMVGLWTKADATTAFDNFEMAHSSSCPRVLKA